MKDNLIKSISLIKEKAQKYELITLSSGIDEISKSICDYRMKILFVGGFSAGKSALINTFLGKDLLEEGQRPETAIAGEVVYDKTEYIEAVSENGSDKYNFSQKDSIDRDKYKYLIWHVDCPDLTVLKNCTIVDMPGFNSGINNHNKAILQYAEKGSAYVLVIDCEEGTIRQNAENFVKEIQNYKSNIAIVVSKSDIKHSDDIEMIKKDIENYAKTLFDEDIEVITTSKFDKEDSRQKLIKLILNFDVESIFNQEYKPLVYDCGKKCIIAMEVYKKSISYDTAQLDEEIEKHEKLKKTLAVQLETKKDKLQSTLINSVAPAIIADATNALYEQSSTLASAIKAGGNSFSLNVNNILRPVLIKSTKQHVEQSFEKFISNIDISNIDFGQSVSSLAGTEDASSGLLDVIKSDNFNGMYKAITTALSVTTTIVAPWLELIVIFLPEVFRIFGGTGRSEESQYNNKVNEVIPQIIAKLQPEIEKTLDQLKDEMIVNIDEQFQERITNEIETLKALKNEQEKRSEEYEQKLNEVISDIACVKAIIEKL